jgi:hypothetical protein
MPTINAGRGRQRSAAPHRFKLGDGAAATASHQSVRAEVLRVERKERNDHQRSDHVDERGDH